VPDNLSAIVALGLCSAVLNGLTASANEIAFSIGETELEELDFCELQRTWGVARPPRICNDDQCAAEHGGFFGDYSGAIYTSPYPNPYSGELWYELVESSRAAARVIDRSALVPTHLVETGGDPLLRESSLGTLSNRRFFDIRVGDSTRARAICDVMTANESLVIPSNCVVTRVLIDGQEYTLAPVAQGGGRW
jgi:hypothetical protein